MYVITGGGSGIGRALAAALSQRGESVLVVGRDQLKLDTTADMASGIETFATDLSTEAGCQALATYCDKFALKGLINNAGTLGEMAPIQTLDLAAWRKTMATNVDAVFVLCQKLYPMLKTARVLNIGSGAAYFPVKGWSAYCVSKAALSMLTRCWQLECEDTAFASVMPGIVDTAMQADIRRTQAMDKEKQQFFIDLKQQQKLVTAETVAAFLCWLLLDVDTETYQSREWDIYDLSHHVHWLADGHQVPPLES